MAMGIVGDEFKAVTIEITDATGKPAKVNGVPVWASSDEKVLHAMARPDGMGGVVELIGVGTAHITVTANADMGMGISNIVGTSEDITVSAAIAMATKIGVTMGTPTPKA